MVSEHAHASGREECNNCVSTDREHVTPTLHTSSLEFRSQIVGGPQTLGEGD
jgi:hypothetical protein